MQGEISTGEGLIMTEVLHRDKIRAHMHNQFGLSDQQIDSMLPSFMDTLAGYLEELETHFAAGNQEQVGRVAHTSKGALLNLGLHEQASLAKDIELRAKAGSELVELESDFKKLKTALKPLLD
jgi:HPt (histidine-containing phosphotransfer) domain-containing protein